MLIRKCTVLAVIILLLSRGGIAQDQCVNYDERYPITVNGKTFLWNPVWNFPNMKLVKVTEKIGNSGYFDGYLKYVPASYSQAQNATKKYPVIIYFHGGASRGNGTSNHLCRLFKDRGGDSATHKAIPGQIERNTAMFTQTIGGVVEEFIVISPQHNKYIRMSATQPDQFPSADEVEDVIDFVESKFRIDKRKIYLTGYSTGANMVIEYAGSSVARAKRVAAIMPVALCSQEGHENNTDRGIHAKHIGEAKLKSWFVYCESDNCGTGSALGVPNKWVEEIMKVPGAAVPRYTRLRNLNPAHLYNCSDSLWHDAWSRAYDPNFTVSQVYKATGEVGANDGINKNMYQWFAAQNSAVLPVTMKSYLARLLNRKVEINWITADERDNGKFLIERAGGDNKFIEIGNIPGMRNHLGDKAYSFVDEKPLPDLNYYRLVQVDIDGEKTYYDVKKVINRADAAIIVSPNPFIGDVSAYVKLDKSQTLQVSLGDMTGKILKTKIGLYGVGSSEVKIASDGLPAGVYLLKIAGESVNSTTRVIKK